MCRCHLDPECRVFIGQCWSAEDSAQWSHSKPLDHEALLASRYLSQKECGYVGLDTVSGPDWLSSAVFLEIRLVSAFSHNKFCCFIMKRRACLLDKGLEYFLNANCRDKCSPYPSSPLARATVEPVLSPFVWQLKQRTVAMNIS